jgi:hypothetical protein
MTATAAQIAELRRMVAEPLPTTYSDVTLQGYIEAYPCVDVRGQDPYSWLLTSPPTATVNTEWIPTYDLHAAAADVWQEKAAALADRFDTSADGASLQRSQMYKQAMGQVAYHQGRRKIRSVSSIKHPREALLNRDQIFNRVKDDD